MNKLSITLLVVCTLLVCVIFNEENVINSNNKLYDQCRTSYSQADLRANTYREAIDQVILAEEAKTKSTQDFAYAKAADLITKGDSLK